MKSDTDKKEYFGLISAFFEKALSKADPATLDLINHMPRITVVDLNVSYFSIFRQKNSH